MPFNIGGSELLLIFIVALVVFGPQRLPDLMRQAARVWRQIQKITNEWQQEFHRAVRELELEDLHEPATPPGYDPATHSVPYQPPDIPHQYQPSAERGEIVPLDVVMEMEPGEVATMSQEEGR